MFEPLHLSSLRNLTKKVLFLVVLATAKRVGELHAISRTVSFFISDACLSHVPEFLAKTESFSNPLPHSFWPSLCLTSLRVWRRICCCVLSVPSGFTFRGQTRSSHRPSHPLSKNVVSFFLREVIHDADEARPEIGSVRAHSIRGVSTSTAFHCNWLVSSVLESATWRTNLVFTLFYLRNLQHEFNKLRSLGPFVATV